MTRPPGRPRTPTVLVTAGTAAAFAFVLVGCANGTATGGSPSTPTTATQASPGSAGPTPTATAATLSASPSPTTRTSTSTPKAAQADVTVEIRIAAGRVTTGVQNVKVRAGQSVMLRGISDVADSLHVHGYDESLALEPGEPAALTFTADVQGVFEVETHEKAELVAKLTVT